MKQRVNWTEKALQVYHQELRYLRKHHPPKTAHAFKDQLKELTTMLLRYPYIGQAGIRDSTLRKIKLRPYFVLYYRVQAEGILVVDLFDGRQDPAKAPE